MCGGLLQFRIQPVLFTVTSPHVASGKEFLSFSGPNKGRLVLCCLRTGLFFLTTPDLSVAARERNNILFELRQTEPGLTSWPHPEELSEIHLNPPPPPRLSWPSRMLAIVSGAAVIPPIDLRLSTSSTATFSPWTSTFRWRAAEDI